MSELSRFRRSRPGRRFQERYWRFRDQTARNSFWWRLVVLILGVIVGAIGFVLLFIPGPGILLLAVGGAMAANQSLLAARVFDWVEVRVRVLLARLRVRWRERRNRG